MISGNRGHGGKYVHALRPSDPRNQFHGKESCAAAGQILNRGGFPQGICHSDHDLTVVESRQIGLQPLSICPGSANLDDHIC